MRVVSLSLFVTTLFLLSVSIPEAEAVKKPQKNCRNPKGKHGSFNTKGCLKSSCLNGKWKTEMNKAICCYERIAYEPNNIISTSTAEDGCTVLTIECKGEGDEVKTVVSQTSTCPKPSSEDQVEELKQLMVNHIAKTDNQMCSTGDIPVSMTTETTTTTTTTASTTTTTTTTTGKMLNPVVLLTGGFTGKHGDQPEFNSVEVFDPLGSCNKDLENLPYNSGGHSTNLFNGEIIMCGDKRCHFLDQNKRFVEHSQLTHYHSGHGAAIVGDTLTIVAGYDSTIVETWNGSEWEARSVDEIEDLQYDSCVDAISKDTLLMVGGSSNLRYNMTNKLMKYYKADKDQVGVWERMEDFPGTPGDDMGCAFIKTPEGDSFLIAGGFGNQRTSLLYNIQKNKWEEVGDLSISRKSGKIVVVDGKVLMLGGWYKPPTVEEYNVETKTWSPIEPKIKQSRGNFGAVVVPGALVGC